jgi:hypothetical protein
MRPSANLRSRVGLLTDVSGQRIGPEMWVRNCQSTMRNVVDECRSQAVYSTTPTKHMHIHILYEQSADILMSEKLIEYRLI